MALVLGTNCGFVTVAPTTDPAGVNVQSDEIAWVARDTSPVTAAKIVEIGWWCDNATQEANFEVGLYAADNSVFPSEAGTRLFVSATNAKGTDAGWKVVSGLDWAISPNTVYWLGYQLDDTPTNTNTNRGFILGTAQTSISPVASLPSPFPGSGAISNDLMSAIYAVWESAPPILYNPAIARRRLLARR